MKKIPEVKAGFLIPKGWFYKQEQNKGAFAFFITKENIDKEGAFYTGLSVNIVAPLRKNNAYNYVKGLVSDYTQNKRVLDLWEINNYSFKGYGFQFLSFNNEKKYNVKIYQLILANNKTNSIYIIIFESPEKEWAESWKIGGVMLEKFAIDDEI